MGGMEQAFIQEAFDTNWVVPLGPNVDGFEADIEKYLHAKPKTVAALSAGTAAIHIGLLLVLHIFRILQPHNLPMRDPGFRGQ